MSATIKAELRRQRRDGDHDIIETGDIGVHTSTAYPDRVTLVIGKRHFLRLTAEDAAWIAAQLNRAARRAES